MLIRDYLQSRHIPFRTVLHGPARSASRRAKAMHVPGRRVAKAVLLNGERGFVLAVLPSTHRIDLDRLRGVLSDPFARLATEKEIDAVFQDCETGALPPFGRLYGLRTLIDASLVGTGEIIFEGNLRHEDLLMTYRDYEEVESPDHARFATKIAGPSADSLRAG